MGLKTKLAMAVATSAAGAAMIAGGSFALFTSSATNSGNTFTAGTVVLSDITNGSVTSQAVNFSNLAPGDNGTVTMTVKNNGTLDEWVKIDGTATAASESAGGLFGGSNPLTLTPSADVVLLHPGDTHAFNITYNFPSAADNTYQSAIGSFSVVADAVQASHNTNATNNGPVTWQ
jgi:spore coat-associated protein N